MKCSETRLDVLTARLGNGRLQFSRTREPRLPSRPHPLLRELDAGSLLASNGPIWLTGPSSIDSNRVKSIRCVHPFRSPGSLQESPRRSGVRKRSWLSGLIAWTVLLAAFAFLPFYLLPLRGLAGSPLTRRKPPAIHAFPPSLRGDHPGPRRGTPDADAGTMAMVLLISTLATLFIHLDAAPGSDDGPESSAPSS